MQQACKVYTLQIAAATGLPATRATAAGMVVQSILDNQSNTPVPAAAVFAVILLVTHVGHTHMIFTRQAPLFGVSHAHTQARTAGALPARDCASSSFAKQALAAPPTRSRRSTEPETNAYITP